MFIGHFGVAFAAKKVAPQTSLGTVILAAQFLDFLWPFFLLLGIEHVRIAPGITRVSYPAVSTQLSVCFGGGLMVHSNMPGDCYRSHRGRL